MRALALILISMCTALAPAAAAAQDAAELRRQIEQLQKAARVGQRASSAPGSPTAPGTRAATPTVPPAAAAPPPAAASPSALDLARPREPFALYQQRGAGQLLFDIGVAGDFVGNITQANVERAGGGTFSGQESRFFPREIELSLFGQVDPYASAVVVIEAGEEERGGEIAVHLGEAYFTLLTLPFGTQAKIGLMRNRYGYINQFHAHDRPWIDQPNVITNFFGPEGLREAGAELTLVPDLPFYLEALVGVFNGDNEDAFGRGNLRHPLATGRLRTFFELGNEHALQLGMSVASGQTVESNRSTILGWDVRYKYRPDGWLHPLITFTSEGLHSFRTVDVPVDLDGDGAIDVSRQASTQSQRDVCAASRCSPSGAGPAASATTGRSTWRIPAGSGRSSRTSRSGRRSSSASGSPTSTPTAARRLATPST